MHLPGGLRLVNRRGPFVEFDAGDGKGPHKLLELPHYDALYVQVLSLGLLPLGVEIVGSRDEQLGLKPSSFRSLDVRSRIPWLCGQLADSWQCLAHAATLEAKPRQLLEDIATRISHELRNCDDLLFNLSKAYEQQRSSALRAGKLVGTRFIDEFTSAIYQALEAFLVRSCVLRDSLAEFYAWISRSPSEGPRITTLSGLLKILKRNPGKDRFASQLSIAAQADGWLHTLGAYRDLIVHGAPISHADGLRVVVVYEAEMKNGLRPLAIKMQMPSNPSLISRERSAGRLAGTKDRAKLSVASAQNAADTFTDALEYSAMALRNLTALAETALTLSPIAPVMPHLGPDDILELTIDDVIPPA
jgi:hypothetical protein